MTLKIRDYKLLCNQGSGDFNEDIIGLSPYGAWVLDGATGLNNKNLISLESDAKWYVNWWNVYLHENIKRDASLRDIVVDGVDKIKNEYLSLIGDNKVETLDFPSCASSIVKFHEDEIEYLLLGDCTLFVQKENDVEIIKDNTLDKFDGMVYEAMENLEGKENMTLNEKKSKLMPLIISNRLKKNTKEGYWSLEFSKEAVENALSGFIKLDKDIKLMMISDGFSCVYDKYEIFEKEDIINIAHSKGIEYINNKIRDLEKKDNMAIEYPRFKIHDDSSCVYLDIYK